MSMKSHISRPNGKKETSLDQRRLTQSSSLQSGVASITSAPASTQPPVRIADTPVDARARTSGWLSYLGLGISGWFIFKAEKTNYFIRFHALQAIFYTATVLLLELALSFLPNFNLTGGLLGILAFLGWIALLLSTYQGEYLHIPLLAFVADRLARRSRQ